MSFSVSAIQAQITFPDRGNDKEISYISIREFSKNSTPRITSDTFQLHRLYWNIIIDPSGNGDEGKDYVSIYLSLAHTSLSCYTSDMCSKVRFSISLSKDGSIIFSRCFLDSIYTKGQSSLGCTKFMLRNEFLKSLVNDELKIVVVMEKPETFNMGKLIPSVTCDNQVFTSAIPNVAFVEDTFEMCLKEEYYPINKGNFAKGYVMIISNDNFSNPKYPQLIGYKIDVERIQSMAHLVFQCDKKSVNLYNNVIGSKMVEILADLKKVDFSDYDYFMMFILSHGNNSDIITSDGYLFSFSTITEALSNEEIKGLKGKPKCIFSQCCRTRSGSLSSVLPASSNIVPIKVGDFFHDRHPDSQHRDMDFFIGQSCFPGAISWTNTCSGSWYLHAICHAITQSYKTDHLMDIMTKVNFILSKKNHSVDKYGSVSQTPVPYTTLTKKFRFYEDKPVFEEDIPQTVSRIYGSSKPLFTNKNKDNRIKCNNCFSTVSKNNISRHKKSYYCKNYYSLQKKSPLCEF